VTLIELLVVIFIVLTVTALAIPIVAPALRGRQIRESSRLVTAYLAGARSEALRTGRATGVVFERFSDGSGNYLPEFCVSLSRCQVPQIYAGSTTASRVHPSTTPATPNEFTLLVPQPPNPPVQNDFWELANVRVGDLIKFDYHGHLYQISELLDTDSDDSADLVRVLPVNALSPFLTVPLGGLPYQVFRQPTRTSTPPVQLPAGIVIDFGYSGDDLGPFVTRDRTSFSGTDYENDPHVGLLNPATHTPLGVMIVFAPDGSIERLYRPNIADGTTQATIRPTGPIHFLIGQRERVPVNVVETSPQLTVIEPDAEVQLETFNFMDLNNLWITVNPRSGLISSTEMFVVPPLNNPNPGVSIFTGGTTTTPIADRVRQSRQFALEGQAMGGR